MSDINSLIQLTIHINNTYITFDNVTTHMINIQLVAQATRGRAGVHPPRGRQRQRRGAQGPDGGDDPRVLQLIIHTYIQTHTPIIRI